MKVFTQNLINYDVHIPYRGTDFESAINLAPKGLKRAKKYPKINSIWNVKRTYLRALISRIVLFKIFQWLWLLRKKTPKNVKDPNPLKKNVKQIKQLTHNKIEICIHPSFPEQITLKRGKFENSLKTRM